jgi:2-polyprenyl-3-methyl-5-hydroxy-6-metoxy-1,4-benzoquinol methylase
MSSKAQKDQSLFFDNLITNEIDTYFSKYWDDIRRLEVKEILNIVKSPKKILDVGCGIGFHDQEIAKSEQVEKVVGIDYSNKSIETANRIYPHIKVERVVEDIAKYKDIGEKFGKFDLVMSFQVIEHFQNPEEFIKNCAQLIASDGCIAIVTPNINRLYNRLRRLLGKRDLLCDPNHFNEYSLRSLVEMGHKLNLTPVASFGHSLYLPSPFLPKFIQESRISIYLGKLFPSVSSIIGIVFKICENESK